MSARYLQDRAGLKQFLQVATAQYVEYMDAVALQADTVVRASDITWASAVATPSVPTAADTTVALSAGGLTNALTAIKISYQFPWGEGPLSAAVTATPTAHAGILLTGASLVPPTPALYTNIYVETSAGSGVFKLWGTTVNGASVIVASYGTGQVPAASPVLSGALQVTQYNFAQLFAGISNQRKCSATGPNSALFGQNQRIFGNSADNQIMVCRSGLFEFDCVSATFQPGQYVGMAKDVGNVLLNQTVVLVADAALSIGQVSVDSNYGGVLQASTKVIVEICSTLNPVPANVFAALGAGAGVLP